MEDSACTALRISWSTHMLSQTAWMLLYCDLYASHFVLGVSGMPCHPSLKSLELQVPQELAKNRNRIDMD